MSSDDAAPPVSGEAGGQPSASPEVIKGTEPAAQAETNGLDDKPEEQSAQTHAVDDDAPMPDAPALAPAPAAAPAEQNAEMIEPAARPQEVEAAPAAPDASAPELAAPGPASAGNTVREIALLLDHMASEDIQTRADAMKQCCLIAEALGPERTRVEFVPFLSELIDDDEEVLYSMIEQLTKLKDHIGGLEHLYCLFPPFEQLCVVEEHSIRRSAVKALAAIISEFPVADCEKHALPLCQRLAASDWHTARMSSPLLCLATYRRVNPGARKVLREWLQALVKDTMPMVRRSLVQALGGAVDAFEKEHLVDKGIIMDMFRQLAGDAQDSVRLLCVEGFSNVANILGPEESQEAMQTMIRQACLDSSWRVRYIAAENFPTLCKMCGPEAARSIMLDIFVTKLLKDQEPEVRAVAAQQIAKVAEMVGNDRVAEKLLPAVKILVDDENLHVRGALATIVVKMFQYVDQDGVVGVVLPIILSILQDQCPNVRLHVLRNLAESTDFVTPEQIRDTLLPCVVDLAIAKSWRVRTQMTDLLPKLSAQLGLEFFNDKLLAIATGWVEDTVSGVRRAAVRNLAAVASQFGDAWAEEHLLPKLSNVGDKDNGSHHYLHRMAVVETMGAVALGATSTKLQSAVAGRMVIASQDSVPNVRMKVVQMIESMRAKDKIPVENIPTLLDLLKRLAGEADPEVIYYANQALRNWDNLTTEV